MYEKELQEKYEKEVFSWFDKNSDHIASISKKIWDYAEVMFQEHKSSELLIKELEDNGFIIEKGVAHMPTAFVATYTSGEGPVVGLLGEYDALPGLGYEIADKPVPTGKNGHGCGHNLIGTAAVAAALAVKRVMEVHGLKGTVKVFGCPAEEGGGAKVFMVRDHVFDGLDAVMAWHPANATCTTMASPLAIISVRYRFHGKSAHAGVCPQLGRSALDAAILMDVGCNYLREHVTPDVRIQSVITNGGGKPNIVPDEAEIWYYIRAPKRQDVDAVFARMNKIAQGMAMATETTVDWKVGVGASSNGLANKALSEIALSNLKKVGGVKFSSEDWEFAKKLNAEVTDLEKIQSMNLMYHIKDRDTALKDLYEEVSEDLMEGTSAPYSGDSSDVSWQTPYCQYSIACQTVGSGNHSWQQVVCSGSSIGQKGMLVAAKAMALSICEFISDKELLARARQEWKINVDEYPYVCPLPEDLLPGDED